MCPTPAVGGRNSSTTRDLVKLQLHGNISSIVAIAIHMNLEGDRSCSILNAKFRRQRYTYTPTYMYVQYQKGGGIKTAVVWNCSMHMCCKRTVSLRNTRELQLCISFMFAICGTYYCIFQNTVLLQHF